MRKLGWLVIALAGGFIFFNSELQAAVLQEDFSSNPAAHGWQIFGKTNLFSWDAAGEALDVTWDSSQPNSYFFHRLGTILGRDDGFSVAFDLHLNDITPGINTNKPGAFELAISLLNLTQATDTNFLRGTGTNSPNLVEFDYFPDAGFGATIWPTFISTNSSFNYSGPTDYTSLALTAGDTFHVQMTYTASNTTLTTTMTRNGSAFGPIHPVTLSTNFTDFRVDTFAISSYSDSGDDFDSLLAHGSVDNLTIITPPPPVTNMTGGFVSSNVWETRFTSRSNWVYTLERTADLHNWTMTSVSTNGNGSDVALRDTQATQSNGFYRVRAERP
jgi:hypothetical protein